MAIFSRRSGGGLLLKARSDAHFAINAYDDTDEVHALEVALAHDVPLLPGTGLLSDVEA